MSFRSLRLVRVAAMPLAMVVGGSLYAAAQSAPGPTAAGGAADSASVLDGVYTAAQAESGAALFEGTCTRCHTADHFVAGGLHAPATKFANLGEMFTRVSTRMPADDPGSLSPDQYAVVVSYLLWMSGYPAGQAELSTDTAKLASIRVVPLPASAGR